MSVAQGDDVQTEVIDGKIYAFGWCWNSNDAKILSPTEVYDPSTDTWATLASMPIPRWGFGTEVIDGKIYAIGDNPGSTCTPTTEVYDPSTDTWTILSAMPTAREEFQTEVIDGKIYAIGGLNISVGDSEGKSLSPTEVYDPSTNTWTTLASMFTARQAFQTEVIDGKIYALGGVGIFDGIDGICISSTEVYDPSSNTWTTLDSMSDERYFSHSEVIDKVIYAIDGRLLESYTVDTNAPK